MSSRARRGSAQTPPYRAMPAAGFDFAADWGKAL